MSSRSYTRPLVAIAVAALLTTVDAHGRSSGAERMKGYAKAFGLSGDERATDYGVALFRTAAPGNIYWPGEQPRFTFQIQSRATSRIHLDGFVDVIRYGTRGQTGKNWQPEVVKLAAVGRVPIAVDVVPGEWQNVTIEPRTPETFGGYALVVDLGEHGRTFLTTYARTFAADPRRVQYAKQALDLRAPEILERLGVQAIRQSVPYVPSTADDYDEAMRGLDEFLAKCHAHKVTVLVQIGGNGRESRLHPIGRGRPHLADDGTMKGGKQDLAWMPEFDDDFEDYVVRIASKHGWPKGPVTAFNLWNEPWESSSISGWQAGIPRYREIYAHLAAGVVRAREEAGVDVLVGGCDSSPNAWDKLFCDGTDRFLPVYDFCSIHYQAMGAPVLYPEWHNRTHHKGRVLIWDTESWVANTDDRVAGVIATYRACGYDRVVAIGHYVVTGVDRWGRTGSVTVKTDDGTKKLPTVPNAWALSASVGALQHFVGEREFGEILFRNGLPWVYVFKGLEGNVEDGTVVVLGDISVAEGDKPHGALLRTVRSLAEARRNKTLRDELASLSDGDIERRSEILKELNGLTHFEDATLTISAADGRFSLYDFYGNPVPARDGNIVVPLDRRGFYLRSDGRAGGFAALVEAVREGRIDGLQPVELVARDFLAPIEERPPLRLRVTNVLNRPVRGTLEVTAEGLTFDHPTTVALAPHETRDIAARVAAGAPRPGNTYPLVVAFDAAEDGGAWLHEDMHVNLIHRRTPVVDGSLDDWEGALPQVIRTDEAATRSMEEAAWLPFETFDPGSAGGFASAFLAWDDDNFYFAAKVADATPHDGTYRFATRPDDEFFYPEVCSEVDADRSFASRVVDGAWQAVYKQIALDLDLPADRCTRVSLYVRDPGKVDVRVVHRTTGRQLTRRKIFAMPSGACASYDLAGSVRVLLSQRHRTPTRLRGVYFDESERDVKQSPYARLQAINVSADRSAYGRLGRMLPGKEPRLPEGVTAVFDQAVAKKEHRWPADVRRYSYRRRFVIPDGSKGGFDNIQIAFNAIPMERDDWLTTLPGRMPRFWSRYKDTDYEYALNTVAPRYGGGSEVWRLQVPGMRRKHFFPRQPKHPKEGAVDGARLVTKYVDGTRITEAAIPWRELPDVRKLLDARETVKFSYRVNHEKRGPVMELARKRSVSKVNRMAFHVVWAEHWANELEFAFDRAASPLDAPAVAPAEDRTVPAAAPEADATTTPAVPAPAADGESDEGDAPSGSAGVIIAVVAVVVGIAVAAAAVALARGKGRATS